MLANSTATDVQVSLPALQIIRSRALEWVPELWVTLHLGLGKGKKKEQKQKHGLFYFLLWVRRFGTQENTLDKDAIYWDAWFSIQMTYIHLTRSCMFIATLILEKVSLPSALVMVHTPHGALGSAPGLWGRRHPRVLSAICNWR